ncbi:DUF5324 family protein [Streptomyces sp. UH6]|uniref:DUF5324 family protein n=1 Tax=Streptomyces sp. UH6 TaxID=2748379 RepID=UPI0015D47856|nr:DUF5324 family protein [Streptomyces sp. UH6]NYV74383.1 DUF5324 family protein [Streptomyces sp. UH6]
MTRKNCARARTGSAKDSVLHAGQALAPYADTARVRAAQYANEARVRLAPVVSQAAGQARAQYGAHVAPRLAQATTYVPAKVDSAAREAALRTRLAAQQAVEVSRPVIEQARANAGPVKEEATARSAAALAALRGQVSPKDIERLVRKRRRRSALGSFTKKTAVLGLLGAAAFAAWRWWDSQANPDWLAEPSEATEVPDDASSLAEADGSGPITPTPEDVRTDETTGPSTVGEQNTPASPDDEERR